MALSLLEWTYLPFEERCERIYELSEHDVVSVRMGQADAARFIDERVSRGEVSREEMLREIRAKQ